VSFEDGGLVLSFPTFGRAVLGAAVLALPVAATASAPGLLSLSSAAPASAPAQTPTVGLNEPENLPLGGPPKSAYITGIRNGLLFRPGDTPLATGGGGGEKFLTRARGGYLLTVDNQTVRYVSDADQRHEVFRAPGSYNFVHDVVVSRDGLSVAITVRSNANPGVESVVVRRITTPITIAQHRFTVPVTVAALTTRRALLTPDGLAFWPHRSKMPTRWWNLHTGHMRLLDKGRPGPRGDLGGRSLADLTAGQLALTRADHNHVVTIPRHPRRAWDTGAHEWVVSWSPNDRYVLTVAWTPRRPRTGNQFDTLAIRRARDGKPITLFKGFQNLYGNSWSPAWENNTTFVVDAEDTCDDGSCANTTNVRCLIHGPCTRVAFEGLPGFNRVIERRLPPS
jgi:hypothetical protein